MSLSPESWKHAKAGGQASPAEGLPGWASEGPTPHGRSTPRHPALGPTHLRYASPRCGCRSSKALLFVMQPLVRMPGSWAPALSVMDNALHSRFQSSPMATGPHVEPKG